MPTWNGLPCPSKFRDGSVERRLGLGRVMPREPPQRAALVGAQSSAHEDDSLDLVERCAELDALDEGRADLVVHPCPCSLPVVRPLCGRDTPVDGRSNSDEELAVFLQLLSVDRDGTAVAQVADHVPVHGGVVHAAGLGVAGPEREVEVPADLLVEEDLLGARLDAVVRPDAELAEAARTIVGVERLEQQLLPRRRARVRDLSVLEPEGHAADLPARVGGRERERDHAVRGVLDRTGEELAVGHVVVPVAGHPGAARDVQGDVGARGVLEADLLLAIHPLGEPLDGVGLALPRGYRILVVGEAGAEEEVLEARQRHAGVRRIRLRGVHRERPAVLAARRPLHRRVEQRLAGLLHARLLRGIDLGQGPRVRVGHDRERHVGRLVGPAHRLRDVVELVVPGQLEEGGLRLDRAEHEERVAARPQDFLVDRLYERLRIRGRADGTRLARLHLRRVAHEYLCECVDPAVPHAASLASPAARIRSTSHAWMRGSSVSSGWKATAMMFPWRTATGCPSTSASTSTPSPVSSTQGARMNTARSASSNPVRSRSDSKLLTCRPKALRSALTSSTPRWSRSSMISPAHVASTGVPPAARARSGSPSPSRSMPRVMVVDSPPGMTSPSSPSRSFGVRTSRQSAPSDASTAQWASKSPWRASTPTTTRGAGSGRSRRERRSRHRPSRRPARGWRERHARGPRSGWWPRRSRPRCARDPRT